MFPTSRFTYARVGSIRGGGLNVWRGHARNSVVFPTFLAVFYTRDMRVGLWGSRTRRTFGISICHGTLDLVCVGRGVDRYNVRGILYGHGKRLVYRHDKRARRGCDGHQRGFAVTEARRRGLRNDLLFSPPPRTRLTLQG